MPDAEFDAALASLVSEHAPHGFAGFMRSARDGCKVYVAATALREALRECIAPPVGCTPYCDGPCSDECVRRGYVTSPGVGA